ncbi:hypothetical protein C7H09_16410 [Marinobacter fuscus]|uniref:DUF1240 domain-containing protein n=1 Tax=Marinobacter fuscus TaxID=2109942 RepID=A0A2T1K4W6_9GAMM|nr:hypothetical protein [Marinobacter fuscus]PSF05181.1 hypothetical protein C7H09_16410 [Marinobacter fuscus]
MGVGLTALSIWILWLNHRDYTQAIQTGAPIFLEDTGITVLYLAPITYLGLALLGMCGIIVAIRGKGFTKSIGGKLNKAVALLVITGLFGMFFGSHIANKLWAEHFENQGYVECSQPFRMTSKWFKAVWVDSIPLCNDRRVLKMFGAGKRVSDINRIIEESRH